VRLRPTAKAGAFLVTGALLVVVGSTAQAGWLFVLAAGVTGPLFASAVLAPRLRSCRPVRRSPQRASVGESLSTVLAVHNGGRRYLPLVRLEDDFPATDRIAVLCKGIAAGATAETKVEAVANRRGRYESGPMTMWSSWPFGLVRSSKTIDVTSSVVVTPRWVELGAFSAFDLPSGTTAHARALDRAGSGEEFLGVREYRAGDDARRVHWRSSARMGRLIAREYEEEGSPRAIIVLAGGDHGTPPDSCFEALVSAAASVALHAMDRRHRVEFVRAADGGFERVALSARVELLDWLATATPRDVALGPLVGRALEGDVGNGTIVLFTPTEGRAAAGLRDAAAAAVSRGRATAAVVADASTWDETASTADDLPTMPCPVHVVRRGEELTACLERS
jgi:uncharacterized protein (DUF58 family)